MKIVTGILSAIEHGDLLAAERLLPPVFDELRQLAAPRLAHQQLGQTLPATAVVREAHRRLMGAEQVEK
jgi:hypothetical protein